MTSKTHPYVCFCEYPVVRRVAYAQATQRLFLRLVVLSICHIIDFFSKIIFEGNAARAIMQTFWTLFRVLDCVQRGAHASIEYIVVLPSNDGHGSCVATSDVDWLRIEYTGDERFFIAKNVIYRQICETVTCCLNFSAYFSFLTVLL